MSEIFINIKNEISQLRHLPSFLEKVKKKFSLDSISLFCINLALDEIISNILKYAYKDNLVHYIKINFSINKNRSEITISIEDDGIPFNPLKYPTPDIKAPLEEREIGNLGIHIVRKKMDSVKYQRHENKNILTLIKKI